MEEVDDIEGEGAGRDVPASLLLPTPLTAVALLTTVLGVPCVMRIAFG